ncbi:MAG: hypothetical protein FD167_554 [bacterium]|nr:MAG: hypothetical protein FD167_554 [bacterium]
MKTEYPSIIPIGITKMRLDEFEEWVKTSFKDSEYRQNLLNYFKEVIKKIQVFRFSFEVWVDGSYLTEKPEPDDIDLLIIISRRLVNKLSQDRQDELYNKYFSIEGKSNIKHLYKCDINFMYKEDEKRRTFWLDLFGYSRDKKPKGIISIKC